MIHIAVDQSARGSIALSWNEPGKAPIRKAQMPLDFGRDSDQLFLPFLRKFLGEFQLTPKQVTHWSVGIGPGSFAGIRFTLALVKGITTVTHALCRGIPASYALVAQWMKLSSVKTNSLTVLQDARCGKLFVSPYQLEEKILPAAVPEMLDVENCTEVLLKKSEYFAVPDEETMALLPEEIQKRTLVCGAPDATAFLDAPEESYPWLSTPEIEPLYVRPPV